MLNTIDTSSAVKTEDGEVVLKLRQFCFLASATNCRPMKTKISTNESWTRCAHSDVFCFRPCFAPASPQPTGPQTQFWLTSRQGEYPRPAKHFDPDARRLQRKKSRVPRPRGHYFSIKGSPPHRENQTTSSVKPIKITPESLSSCLLIFQFDVVNVLNM